jgi:hypothetical protein
MKKYGQGEVLAEDDEEQQTKTAAANWTEDDAKALEAENAEADSPQ